MTETVEISAGDTAWVLTAAALVLFMTPGLALLYGGMVRSKSVLNMMMMSFSAMIVVAVIWPLWGHSMAFGDDVGAGLVGNPFQHFGLESLIGAQSGTIPTLAFSAFQATFAMIAVALVSGAIADRAKFSAWLVFAGLWATFVYFPVAHWVFDFSDGDHVGGWIANNLKALDFAGGTAIEINTGATGLALALVLGRRLGFGREAMRPHNLPLTMLGAGILWFGWFGFNAGSALGANGDAAVVWMNTLVAPGAAAIGWLIVERLRDGHFTSLGAASGLVAGLVAITPSCASVTAGGAIAVGLLAGSICAFAVPLKFRWKYDDSLDVVGVHLVGGIVGTLSIGFFASSVAPTAEDGLFYGGGFGLLGRQAVAALAVLAYSFVMGYILALLVDKTIGFRVDVDDERGGVDQSEHAESGYDLHNVSGGVAGFGRN